MGNEYKQCPNGHYYQGTSCPYCKSSGNSANTTSAKTEVFGGGNSQVPTEVINGQSGGTKTTMAVGSGTVGPENAATNRPVTPSRTVFGPEDDSENTIVENGQSANRPQYRTSRKLVGWLVSYTLDTMGVDFKLYEGRNIIGRDADCSISVDDNMVSSKHATLLFKTGKYAIKDEMSSHGTFVNGNDIGLEPCYLQDGDEIKMGKTLFKFRTSF